MKSTTFLIWFLITTLIVGIFSSNALALPISEAVQAIADRLVVEQMQEGDSRGIWPEEADFTGSIVAGMADAYELTSESAYKASAEFGGDYIFLSAQGSFYGDEAFALTRLSQIATDPCNNAWRTAVDFFYFSVKHDFGNTKEYIDRFIGTEPSTAVFYVANHVVAAYFVDAEDREIWRQGLIDWLARVDDSSEFPVMALGIATWALAQTGPLDETLIDPSGEGAPYWKGKKLADLPGLLLSHQVASGLPGAGSFYWQFQHDVDAPNGYTEDTIFPTLGLVAASWANPDLDLDSAILAAREVLLGGISWDGIVRERLSQEGEFYYAYAGEMLQVLAALPIPGDINLDGNVDLIDLEILINNWGVSDCSEPSWCEGADLDKNGQVNIDDLEIMLDNWLIGKSD